MDAIARLSGPDRLSTRAAADLIGLSERTLRRMRAEGRGPVYMRIGPGTISYLRSDVERWLASRRVETCDATPEARA